MLPSTSSVNEEYPLLTENSKIKPNYFDVLFHSFQYVFLLTDIAFDISTGSPRRRLSQRDYPSWTSLTKATIEKKKLDYDLGGVFNIKLLTTLIISGSPYSV